jgi:DNA polymerase III delta prime subunit
MNISFLKKYQPQFFSEFEIDQEYINILKTLINIDNLNILIIGDIGSGKTSLLLAIIKEYYSTVKNKQLINENIMHINNLKEQGIQYYRNEVKIFCQTKSSIQNKKKIIMIDDFDYINEQSQQVFRNCIDKYSNNVHFITSCKNTQKIIDSIQSRVTILKLKPLSNKYLKNILNKIKDKENIILENELEEFILNISNYSIRQLINYMEKFKILDIPINKMNINEICTNLCYTLFEKYTNVIIFDKNLQEATSIIYNIYNEGYSVMDILDRYFLFIKNTKIINEETKYKIIKIICEYISHFHTIHEEPIELVLFTNSILKLNCNFKN